MSTTVSTASSSEVTIALRQVAVVAELSSQCVARCVPGRAPVLGC